MGQQAPPWAASGGPWGEGPALLHFMCSGGRGTAGLLCQMKLRGAALWHAPQGLPDRTHAPAAEAPARQPAGTAELPAELLEFPIVLPNRRRSHHESPLVPQAACKNRPSPPQNSPRCRQTAKRPRPPHQSPSEWHDMRIIVVQLTLVCANAVARNRAESATIGTRILTL